MRLLRAFGLVGTLGTCIAVPPVLAALAGKYYLESNLAVGLAVVAGLVLGMLSAAFMLARMTR